MANSNQKPYIPEKDNNPNMHPGDRNGSPDESFFSQTLVFIDAGFLSKLSGHFGKGNYLIYDLIKFIENIAKKEKLFTKKIFYYTAPPFQSDSPTEQEESRREKYDKFIKKLTWKKVIVREGRCQRLKIDGKFIFKQKSVDILLALDLADTPSSYPDIKKIILFSSDSDFVPIIKRLREKDIKTILYTHYEKKRNTELSRSNELIKSVHKYVLLTKEDFEKAPLTKT